MCATAVYLSGRNSALWSDSPFDFNNTNNHSWTLHVACCERLVAPSNATHNRAAESRPQASNTSSAHTSWGMHVCEKRRGKQTFVICVGGLFRGVAFQKKNTLEQKPHIMTQRKTRCLHIASSERHAIHADDSTRRAARRVDEALHYKRTYNFVLLFVIFFLVWLPIYS